MNPNDFGNIDQASLLQAIQNYAAMLAQQKQANDEMGVNPQIIQGQSNVDQARVQAAQGLLDAPAVAPGQNWEQNPNSVYGAIQKRLLEQGPVQAAIDPAAGVNASVFQRMNQMAANKDWQRQIESAAFKERADTRMLTPQEMQAREIATMQAPLDAATGLLGATKPQQAFDPTQLQAGLPGMAAVATGAQGSRNSFMDAQSKVRSAELAAQGQIGAAKATAAGVIGAEQAKLGAEGSKLAKSTKGALEKQVVENEAMQSSLQTLGKTFNPDFFKSIPTKYNELAQQGEKALGIPLSQAQRDFTTARTSFIQTTRQMFNDYRKQITGAAAAVQELDRLEASIFNEKLGPTAAKAALLDLMTTVQLKSFIAKNALEKGIIPNGVQPRTEAFGDYVDSVASAGDYSKMKEAIRSYYLQQNPALNPNPVPNKPATARVYTPEERAAALAALQARKQQAQGQ